jgi:hypothetical protein
MLMMLALAGGMACGAHAAKAQQSGPSNRDGTCAIGGGAGDKGYAFGPGTAISGVSASEWTIVGCWETASEPIRTRHGLGNLETYALTDFQIPEFTLPNNYKTRPEPQIFATRVVIGDGYGWPATAIADQINPPDTARAEQKWVRSDTPPRVRHKFVHRPQTAPIGADTGTELHILTPDEIKKIYPPGPADSTPAPR